MTSEERRAEVEQSSCNRDDCTICADYIETGKAGLRPPTREDYERVFGWSVQP